MQGSHYSGRNQAGGASAHKGASVKRSRGRGRRPQNNNPNRTYDSTGPEVKVRGSASHVYEKYLQMARDANSSGDRVLAENYLQHAEHYYRIMAAMQATQQAQGGKANGDQPQINGNGSGPSFSLMDEGDDEDENEAAAAE